MASPTSLALIAINRALRLAGLNLRTCADTVKAKPADFSDVEPWVSEIIERVRPYTMTSDERISALCHAVRYIVSANVPGDVVECGVWRGGSMMAAALAMSAAGECSRTFHLFDTFQGMTAPTEVDREAKSGIPAANLLEVAGRSSNIWAYATIGEVRKNLTSVSYPASGFRLIEGKVEDTIPDAAPEVISLLRLDTDWYDSTWHELVHLYPRLAVGGVLIIDDYGYWEGARKAVDQYISENRLPILLQRIDNTGRIAVKTAI